MLFWILCGASALVVAAALAAALLRGRPEPASAESHDLRVYRDQLAEIDRDRTRGTIGPEEAERLRAEVSRRILATDSRRPSATAARTGGPSGWIAAGVMTLVLVGAALALYRSLGAPGYPDQALAQRIAMARDLRETRPSQSEAEAALPATPPAEAPPEYLALVERLRGAVADRPGEVQGHVLLARSEAALGNYRAAAEAQQRVIDLKGDSASPEDYADLADMLVLAAGGYVSPEAEAVLDETLRRDPGNGVARYYGGLMMAQTGRPDAAFRLWDALLRDSAPDDPWVPAVMDQIPEMAARAGVNNYQPPVTAPLPGPSAEDMDAAAGMSEEDRQLMIEGMVSQLSDRLAAQGGTPQEWARLLSALGVLGDTDRARAIWAEAQTVFATRPEALATVRAGAEAAGVAE
ncbi:c-type cytochrome biogenesis protein CcmI [Salipiger marinus]|uniref:c-type cytochrome biogenesis protein CcmI n=1 Tax=Salipiger marinus TaxID=555512 RepID=UPI00405844C3